MIDNIRFVFKHNPKDDWLKDLRQQMFLVPMYNTTKGDGYKGSLYLDKDIRVKKKSQGTKGVKMPSLQVKLHVGNDGVRVSISNSLRKWYYNDSINRDFTLEEFIDCLEIISKRLNVPLDVILDSEVTRAEYGANLTFKQSYRCFYLCIFSHKKIMKKAIIGDETLAFIGENKKVIFYDKITEVKSKKRMSARIKKEINKRAISIRYEINKTKIVKGDSEYSLMKRLGDIIENWNLIIDLWETELEQIIFVNNMSPGLYNFLEDTQIKEMSAYLTYLGIEKVGIENLQALISDRALPTKQRDVINKFTEIYNLLKVTAEKENFEKQFKEKVSKKGNELRV